MKNFLDENDVVIPAFAGMTEIFVVMNFNTGNHPAIVRLRVGLKSYILAILIGPQNVQVDTLLTRLTPNLTFIKSPA